MEKYVIQDVTLHYANIGVNEITRIAKRTEPFVLAQQYTRLEMNKSPEYERLVHIIDSKSEAGKKLDSLGGVGGLLRY